MNIFLTLLFAFMLLGTASVARAAESNDVEARLAKQLGLKLSDVTPAPIPGVYRIIVGPQVAYVSADGRYLIRGDIINLQSGDNLTVVQRAEARLAYLKQLDPVDMIVFAPPHPKHTITVLTDIDCDYCRVLERDRPKLNAMGIAVQYLFFPRDGAGSASWQKAVEVWCAKDRKAAFEAAMSGTAVKSAKCNDAAVTAGYQFGQLLGLDGTPAIITDRGRLIDGYLPPRELASVLDIASSPAQ
ncbi:MAG: thioredoxin fold domain-containing protein [Gammaproteobacteria bacterium]